MWRMTTAIEHSVMDSNRMQTVIFVTIEKVPTGLLNVVALLPASLQKCPRWIYFYCIGEYTLHARLKACANENRPK